MCNESVITSRTSTISTIEKTGLTANKSSVPLGFEVQRRREQAEIRAQEEHQVKKDAHYWDVLKKDGEACQQISQNVMQEMDAMEKNPDFPAQFEAELQKRNVKSGQFNLAVAA